MAAVSTAPAVVAAETTAGTATTAVVAAETAAGTATAAVVTAVTAAAAVVITTRATRPVIPTLEPTRRTPTTVIIPT
ncbi:hypothetical protein PUR34_14115, partial [Streptomyces sp. JV185]|uniref:hypothetical protein n=1 Tax=Streptomyces sp. JV185 TaxID=858638 RepID=UPI002E794179